MTRYLAGRVLQLVPLLWAASTLVFVLMRLIPGDPTTAMLGADSTEEQRQALREALGLQGPLHLQYIEYYSRLFRGDLGTSLFYREQVSTLVLRALPATLQLAACAVVLAVLTAIPLGMLAALRRGGLVDRLATALAVGGAAIPGFWMGVILILVFSVQLRLLPSSGIGPSPWTTDNLRYLILPTFTLALGLLASTTRLTRSVMLEVLAEDYIRTARSKGLHRLTVLRTHALRNALIPIVTNIGLQVGALLGGALLVETVFAWPGLGRLSVDAMGRRDYPLVQGVVLLTTATFAVINLLVDAIYGVLDPRIRYS